MTDSKEWKRRWRLVGRTSDGHKIYTGSRTPEDRAFARKQTEGKRGGPHFTPKS